MEEEVTADFERYRAELESFDQVRSGRVPWLWAGRITYGALTSLAGRPKVGKGTFYSWLASQVTTGGLDGDSFGIPRSVLIVTSEDAATFTLKPRLVAAGADLKRVYHQRADSDAFRLPQDVEKLCAWVTGRDIGLVIIDPLVEFIDGKVDTHKSADVRQALMPLVQLAQDHRFAVLGVYHLNKARSNDLLLRQEAAAALTQITRAGLFLGHDPSDPEGDRGSRRVLAVAWSNLAKPAPSLALQIEGKIVELDDGQVDTQPVAVLVGESELDAGDLLTERPQADDETKSVLDEAVEFLLNELASGPMVVKALKEAAGGAGISWRTIERAKHKIGNIATRRTGGTGAPYEWSLRPDPKSANRVSADLADLDLADLEMPVNAEDLASPDAKSARTRALADLAASAAEEPTQKQDDSATFPNSPAANSDPVAEALRQARLASAAAASHRYRSVSA